LGNVIMKNMINIGNDIRDIRVDIPLLSEGAYEVKLKCDCTNPEIYLGKLIIEY